MAAGRSIEPRSTLIEIVQPCLPCLEARGGSIHLRARRPGERPDTFDVDQKIWTFLSFGNSSWLDTFYVR